MKWIIIILAIIAALIAIVFLIGYFMPVNHSTSITIKLDTSPEKVWNIITDYKNFPAWRRGMKNVVPTDLTHWIEISEHGTIHYEAEVFQPHEKFVSRIKSKDLAFGGAWSFDLKPDGVYTQLTIEENGEVYNPIFRFMSKYIFGHETTLRNYVTDLKNKVDIK